MQRCSNKVKEEVAVWDIVWQTCFQLPCDLEGSLPVGDRCLLWLLLGTAQFVSHHFLPPDETTVCKKLLPATEWEKTKGGTGCRSVAFWGPTWWRLAWLAEQSCIGGGQARGFSGSGYGEAFSNVIEGRLLCPVPLWLHSDWAALWENCEMYGRLFSTLLGIKNCW